MAGGSSSIPAGGLEPPVGQELTQPAPESDLRRVGVRFLLAGFAVLAALQVCFHVWVVESSAFESYLRANAVAGATLLRTLGFEVQVLGRAIAGEGTAVRLDLGCDGLQPSHVFLAAVMTFPAPWIRRLLGAAVGLALLLGLNVVRVVTLFLVKAWAPTAFGVVHEHVWPAAFILAALVLFVLWLRLLQRPPAAAR